MRPCEKSLAYLSNSKAIILVSVSSFSLSFVFPLRKLILPPQSPRRCHLSILPVLGMGAQEFLPTPWKKYWPTWYVKRFLQQPQLLWVIRAGLQSSPEDTAFLHLFASSNSHNPSVLSFSIIPEIYGKAWYRCLICGWTLHIFLFSALWKVLCFW